MANSRTNQDLQYRDYNFYRSDPSHMHRHFLPPLFELCANRVGPQTRILDVGCGNGYTCGQFLARGGEVVGIDLSESGIALARATYPDIRFELLPADDHLLENLQCEPF